MQLTEESYRALARSSPWRWTSLHFTRHSEPQVEAWIRRPGELQVRDATGRTHFVPGPPYTRSEVRTAYLSGDAVPGIAPPTPPEPFIGLDPQQVTPQLRPDGLVAVRPDDFAITYGDPMWEGYRWVAMLDPVELSSATHLEDLRTGTHRGRPVWRARARALPGYDPTCGCCPLLWSEISDRDERGGDPGWVPSTGYPDAYLVCLDVETGIVIQLEPIGGRDGDPIDLEIHQVDPDLDAMFT